MKELSKDSKLTSSYVLLLKSGNDKCRTKQALLEPSRRELGYPGIAMRNATNFLFRLRSKLVRERKAFYLDSAGYLEAARKDSRVSLTPLRQA